MKKHTFPSKIGVITLLEEHSKIVEIQFGFGEHYKDEQSEVVLHAKSQILSFLEGKIKEMDFPYLLQGTEIEQSVMTAMKTVKYGETISYKELAVRSGNPSAFRAVGSICRKNKLPLLFPCHRIIKSDGSTGQYAGGIPKKQQLLLMENNYNID